MATNYAKITKAEQKNVEGGYKNVVLFVRIADIMTEGKPVDPPVALGDTVTIATAHMFDPANGFISWLCKKHSVTTTSETTGDDGAQSFIHKAKFILLGDSASTLEQVKAMLNDDLLWLLKDQECVNGSYVQFGDSCLSPTATVTFDGKTTKEGQKEYTVELTVKDKKYFYNAAVTEKPVV